ncbi:MAG: glycoside hydrolase family 16 protein [Candidatus Coproplasma sp.]
MVKKLATLILCGLMLCTFTACSNPSNTKDPSNPDNPSNSTDKPDVAEPTIYTWDSEPVATNVFFDDFENGIDTTKWKSTDTGWGANNNGVSSSNVMYSTDKEKVEAEGATGGVVVLKSTGDYSEDKNTRRQGAVIITQEDFGAGKYEVRMKALPRAGQCTAIWTYWNGTPETTVLEESKYSEIDIELPENGDMRAMSSTVYEKYIDKTNMNSSTTAYKLADKGLDMAHNDGDWHTYSFEWRTDDNGKCGIIWSVDGITTAKISTNIPVYTAPLWIGTWFPDNPGWIGVPNFETAYMYIDWVRITQYGNEQTIDECDQAEEVEYSFTDLGDSDIPQTDYIANGNFEQYEKSGSTATVVGWNAEKGSALNPVYEDYVNYLQIDSANAIYQAIEDKYYGQNLRLEVDAEIIEGDGKLYAYIQEYYGILARDKSPDLTIWHNIPNVGAKTLTYTLTNKKTDQIRIVLKTDEGTVARVKSVRLYLV